MDVKDMDLEEFINSGPPLQEMKREKKKLNCDQVSWLKNALDRLQSLSEQRFPAVSQMKEAAKLATLLEIMEVLGYEFEEDAAAGNALSRFWQFNELRGIH
jgi:hypothetical protein